MMGIDQEAGRRVESAPEAERLVEDEGDAAALARHQGPPRDRRHGSPHRSLSRTTRPVAAERTHSSRLPRTVWNPRVPGAYHAHFAEFVITGPDASCMIGTR